jgi:hypothetical protein
MTRTQPRTDGSLALKLDFGFRTVSPPRSVKTLRLLQGPDKYKVLEHRRRQAQIAARRLLDLMERTESAED